MEQDKSEFRGTGGLLANIAVDYDDDDMILVGNAAQVLLEPLPELWTSLHQTRGVVGLIGHREGEPSGLMLITCRALRLIPKSGFVDMKEQALPIIASKFDVRVLQRRRPTGLPIRSLSDYIAALRALHQPVRSAVTDPWAEDWRSTFAIIEPGAVVSSSARIHDSVVLAGGSVEMGARGGALGRCRNRAKGPQGRRSVHRIHGTYPQGRADEARNMKLPALRDDRLTLAHVALATMMGALGVLATLDAWRDIYLIAREDEEYSHIFIVPLVAIFLVWVRKVRLRHCKPSGRIIGPVVVAVGWFFSSLGFYSGIQSFWHGGAVLVVVGCMLSVLGKNVIFRFFPAFALLIFLVPGRREFAWRSPLRFRTGRRRSRSTCWKRSES